MNKKCLSHEIMLVMNSHHDHDQSISLVIVIASLVSRLLVWPVPPLTHYVKYTLPPKLWWNLMMTKPMMMVMVIMMMMMMMVIVIKMVMMMVMVMVMLMVWET